MALEQTKFLNIMEYKNISKEEIELLLGKYKIHSIFLNKRRISNKNKLLSILNNNYNSKFDVKMTDRLMPKFVGNFEYYYHYNWGNNKFKRITKTRIEITPLI
jgi:hypothetical protein